MKFISNIKKETYEKFVKTNKYKSHFLQSYTWGEFAKREKNLLPHYVGLIDDKKNLVCACLLLEKKLPFGYSYFYSPRGYVIDFTDQNLVKKFTQEIVKYIKTYKAIFLKIDPDIILNEKDNLGNDLKIPYDGYKIVDNLKKIGFKHLGFTKNFELFQPRYTFRINLEDDLTKIEEKFSKTVNQRIKKAEELEVEVTIGTKEDVKNFYELMKITENRKDFVSHNLSYYQTLYELWNKDNCCNIFFGKINLNKVLKIYQSKKKILEASIKEIEQIESPSKSQNTKKKELTRQLDKLKNDILKYQEDKEKYGEKIILNAHFIIEYGDKAWVLYAGNHNILSETGSNYKVYQTHLEYCYNKKIKIYDQFGTIGDIREDNPLYGLHDFKKKFGGNYIEFIGEFDLVTNKIMYFAFTKLVPLYRKLIKKIAKKKNKVSL